MAIKYNLAVSPVSDTSVLPVLSCRWSRRTGWAGRSRTGPGWSTGLNLTDFPSSGCRWSRSCLCWPCLAWRRRGRTPASTVETVNTTDQYWCYLSRAGLLPALLPGVSDQDLQVRDGVGAGAGGGPLPPGLLPGEPAVVRLVLAGLARIVGRGEELDGVVGVAGLELVVAVAVPGRGPVLVGGTRHSPATARIQSMSRRTRKITHWIILDSSLCFAIPHTSSSPSNCGVERLVNRVGPTSESDKLSCKAELLSIYKSVMRTGGVGDMRGAGPDCPIRTNSLLALPS